MQKSNLDHLVVYADGGCLNNGNANGSGVISCYGSFLVEAVDTAGTSSVGKHEKLDFPQLRTVNEAEYSAFIATLKYLNGLMARIGKQVPTVIYIDSRLVYTQVTGKANCKAPNLLDFHATAQALVDACTYDLHWIDGKQMKAVLGH